mgnify:CR=1 FL=1
MERQNAVFNIIVLLASLVVSPLAQAQSTQYKKKVPVKAEAPSTEQKPGQAAPQGASDKVDITELEEKYWSSKDTDFSVVQNRTYTKEKRIALTTQWGKPTSDSYNTGSLYNLGLNFYFNERNGVGIEYNKFEFNNSKLVNVFVNSYGNQPDRTRHKSFVGLFYNWVPVYAKVSLLSKKILYFDLSISPGIGMTEYDQFVLGGDQSDSTMSYCLDVSQHFFLSKQIALRFDFKNRWQKEKVLEYNGATVNGRVLSNDMVQSTFLMFGLQYFF